MSALYCRSRSPEGQYEMDMTHQASPSLILTMPRFALRSDIFTSETGAITASSARYGGGPSPLISTFLSIAAVADDDKSLAIIYLRGEIGFNASLEKMYI